MHFFRYLLAAVALLGTVAGALGSSFKDSRVDFRDETIYFVMTTRFYDGDPANNVLCWDNAAGQIADRDPAWRGDFKGLIDKLDYIKALGFTAVWITPVVQNCSGYDYHGYHAMDFGSVDVRLQSRRSEGSAEDVDFQALIDAAHARDMKVVLDIVLNHNGNFGEATLCPMFERNPHIRNQASAEAALKTNEAVLGSDYAKLRPAEQYGRRLALMKNMGGVNHDKHNYWHHIGSGWNWDYPNRWWGQIAGDCVDLNTENQAVSDYLVRCYGEFIKMGVDGFRIDTSGHISRLTFNKSFIPQFTELGRQYAHKRLNGCPFFMFGEVCSRYSEVVYRGQNNLSSFFYTWQSPKASLGAWNTDATWWDQQVLPEGCEPTGNMLLCLDEPSDAPESDNALMLNGKWHQPDYSRASGFSVIDFPMHYTFNDAGCAVNIARQGDRLYNDATYNVVYVDSHDYSPGPNDGVRFDGGTAQWAENLALMFTFRGIPCLYYGSEIEFQKGVTIDKGPLINLSQSGRAYYGQYLDGSVTATDFGQYTASGNVAATLGGDLAQHIVRLNMIRAAVPALRRGQYTFDGCTARGGWAFKRATSDSYALVAVNGGATFTDVPAGQYTDVVTGRTYQSTGTITVEAPATKGQLRVLVKDWTGGRIGTDGQFMYTTTPVHHGDAPRFADPGAERWYGSEDADAAPGMQLSPDGGAFRTETLSITATLTGDAESGTVTLPDGTVYNVTKAQPATFTIGQGMKYNETVTVSWTATGNGDTVSGTAVYRKVDPNASISIYVKADKAPYVYAWTGSNTQLTGSWPGTAMTETVSVGSVSYWRMTFDAETVNVVLNNGSGAQTPDIRNITADVYLSYDGASRYTVIENPSDPNIPQPEKATYTVYFDNTGAWDKVYAYIYGGNYSNWLGGWPGKEMTAGAEKGTHSLTFEGEADMKDAKIIFSSGNGKQTPDNVGLVNGALYGVTGVVQAGVADATSGVQVSVAAGRLVVAAAENAVVSVTSVDGRCRRIAVEAGVTVIELPRGFYVVNGRKIIL